MSFPLRRACAAGLASALILGAAAAPGAVQAADTGPAIGAAKYVKKWAWEQVPDVERDPLYARDDVFQDQRIWTVKDAATRLILDDGTDIRLGERAEIVLDEYTYDPDKSTGEVVSDFLKGSMRYVSGAIPSAEQVVETPAAILGLRGTTFDAFVDADGTTRVEVIEGAVEVESKATGGSVTVSAGRGVTVSPEQDTAMTTRDGRPSYDPALQNTAGVAPGSGNDGGSGDAAGAGGGHGDPGGGDGAGDGGGDAGGGDGGGTE